MQVVEITDVWVKEPRWSWFRTPLWKCAAVKIEIRRYELKIWAIPFGGGSMMTLPPSRPIEYSWIYFTNEEYVMFKLEHYTENQEYNMSLLNQGVIYH
jgi:hypothetical protein